MDFYKHIHPALSPEQQENYVRLAYQVRVLGAEQDSPLEDWLTSQLWRCMDETAEGAAMRLMYVLDYGVPADFAAIRDGQVRSDYLSNGFLWDRIGMMRPQRR